MNCKNCNHALNESEFYCEHCGAKIITERLTIKALVQQLMTDVFGWDNKYFKTTHDIVVRPKQMFESYLGGTRKRYMNPLGFMLIGLTFSIFTFNFFREEYLDISIQTSKVQLEWLAENLGGPYKDPEFQKEQLETSKKTQEFILKYFNLFTFLLLPFYALLSKFTFGKPLNYAEHLTINTYLQGVSFVTTPILFAFSVWLNPNIFLFGLILTMTLYCYVYKNLYGLSIGETILKLIIFLAFVFASAIALVLIIGVGVFIYLYISKSLQI